MATVVSTSTTPKMKPPPPPSIHTSTSNFRSSSSPSPSLSSKRPSATPRQTTSLGPNSATANGTQSRSQVRQRKESQKASQSRGNGKSNADGADALLADLETAPKQPYVRTSEHILRKFNGFPPSLVLHLHPTYFRLDQQDGSFGYNSPMKIILEHVKAQTIPHDMLEELEQADVPFYDGCLIVEIHNHKSTSSSTRQAREPTGNSRYKEFSVHNYNQHVTPSPYVPYPSPPADGDRHPPESHVDPKSQDQTKGKGDVSDEDLQAGKVNRHAPVITFTTVLHPTSLSRHRDLCIEAATPAPEARGGKKQHMKDAGTPMSGYPPTPVSAFPPTPTTGKGSAAKRQRMRLEENNVHSFEAEILRNTEQTLFLEPAESFADVKAILQSLTHPLHDQKPPIHKGRKRTVAELAADEAQAAEEERIALVFDERLKATLNSSTSGNGPSAETHNTSKDFEPNFSRFKTLEDIKRRIVEETARKREEDGRKKMIEKEQERAMERQKRAEEEARRQKELLARQEAAQLKAQQAAVAQANGASLLRGSHAAQQQMMHNYVPQSSQGQQGSPMIRAHTPSHSSPVPGNLVNGQAAQSVPMGNNPSNNSLGSPPRPGSALQMSSIAQPMTRQPSQQPSQASQSRQGTPQMPHMTPQMNHGQPGRNITPQPRIQQSSPSAGPMQGNPMMGVTGAQHMNTQNMSQAQQAWLLQQQRQVRHFQQQPNAQMNGPGNVVANQMNPQKLAALQQQHQQQLQHQQRQQQLQQQQQQQQQQEQQQKQQSAPQSNPVPSQMTGLANQSLISQQKQQEYRRRRVQEAEAKIRAGDQQHGRPPSQPQPGNVQPASSGPGYAANPAIVQNVARTASYQHFLSPQPQPQSQQHQLQHQQNHSSAIQNVHMSHMQPNQTGQQAQLPHQNQNQTSFNLDIQGPQVGPRAQMASQMAGQMAARMPARPLDRQSFQKYLEQKNGGQIPPNAEHAYQVYVQSFTQRYQQQRQRQMQMLQMQQQQQGQHAQSLTQVNPHQMQHFGFENAIAANQQNTNHLANNSASGIGSQGHLSNQVQKQLNGINHMSGMAGRGGDGANFDFQPQ